jgi:hypothetical protein
MADEIELVSDDEGAIVLGNRAAVERFLSGLGLLTQARAFDLEEIRAA